MSAARRPRLQGAERRRLLEEAAGRLFGEQGYAATRLSDIAAAAHVTKPMLYRHFDSKKALYLALLSRHRDDLPRFAEQVADHPPELRREALLDAWLAYVQDHGYAWRMLFRDTSGDAEIQAFRRKVQTRAREVMAGLIQAEISIPSDEVKPLAEFLRSGGAGLALWWLEHPEVPRPVVLATLTRIANGLTARSAATKP
jgi:AcrR family transcriptional regulator